MSIVLQKAIIDLVRVETISKMNGEATEVKFFVNNELIHSATRMNDHWREILDETVVDK